MKSLGDCALFYGGDEMVEGAKLSAKRQQLSQVRIFKMSISSITTSIMGEKLHCHASIRALVKLFFNEYQRNFTAGIPLNNYSFGMKKPQ